MNLTKMLKISKEFIKKFKLEGNELTMDYIIIAAELAKKDKNEIEDYISSLSVEEQKLIKKMVNFWKGKE
jgi:hypothetical protein